MICHDCRPIRDAVQLCERHADMDRNQVVLEAMTASGEADDKQRRRYALLQASATIDLWRETDGDGLSTEECVDRAEDLLTEIESREKREPEKQG